MQTQVFGDVTFKRNKCILYSLDASMKSNDGFMYKSDRSRVMTKACSKETVAEHYNREESRSISSNLPSVDHSKPKLGVVERFNRTIKLYLNKLMAGYDTPNWAALLPEALYYYNFQHKDRAIGMSPTQADDEEEGKIASQKAEEIAQIQD